MTPESRNGPLLGNDSVNRFVPPRGSITRISGQLRELGDSLEMENRRLSTKKKNGKKEGIRLYREDFIVCCSDIQTIMNPLPGKD
jgi:hypothetical protein